MDLIQRIRYKCGSTFSSNLKKTGNKTKFENLTNFFKEKYSSLLVERIILQSGEMLINNLRKDISIILSEQCIQKLKS